MSSLTRETTSGTSNESILGRRDSVFMNNYGRPPLALVRGQGCTVYDADGKASSGMPTPASCQR